MTIRKVIAASAVGLGVLGGSTLLSGVAFADRYDPQPVQTFPTETACTDAGLKHIQNDGWEIYKCWPNGSGGFDLYRGYNG